MIERKGSPKTDYVKKLDEAKTLSRLDRIAFAIAPGFASARVKSRVDHQIRMMMADKAVSRFSAWEAADTDRIRGEKWLTSKLSSNDQIQAELQTLIDRALDLYRNDCYAASAINGRVDNVVGIGMRPQSRVQAERGILTQSQADEFNTMAEWLWKVWSDAVDFTGQQRQMERCQAIFGESWLYLSDEEDPTKPITLTTQVINPQRIPLCTYGNTPGVRRRLGCRLDSRNRPIGYYVTRGMPNDSVDVDMVEDEVDADRMLHAFEAVFPGQLRGVPWLAPAMARLKDLKDFAHAHLCSEQVAACFSAFVQGVTDPVVLAEQGRSRSNLEDLAPATIQYLGDGENIVFGDPARPGTTLAPYMKWALQGVAAGLRYPYELLIKEFTNNFSGGRLALIDGRITFRVWQSIMIQQQLRPLWAAFIDRCAMQGAIKVDLMKYEANRSHFLQHQWIPPGWPWVDPEKEVAADVLAIENGLLTQTESLAARGRDFEETLARSERETIAKLQSQARIESVRKSLGLSAPMEPGDGGNKPSAKGLEQPQEDPVDATN